MKLFNKQFVVVFWFLAFCKITLALNPVVITDDLKEICLSREYVMVFEDSSHSMTLDEVLTLQNKESIFKPSTAQDLINKNKTSAYWLKFILVDNTLKGTPFRIELFDFDIDEVTLYTPDDNQKYEAKKAGFNFPFRYREALHKNISYKVPLENTSKTFYMRFYSSKHNVLEPMVRSTDFAVSYWLNEYLLFGIFYGLLLLMIFYNLLYFLFLRTPYYFYYVLYGTGTLLFLMGKNGTGFQYLWGNYPQVNDVIGPIGLFISTFSLVLFSDNFLELKKVSKPSHKVLMAALLVRFAFFILEINLPHLFIYSIIDFLFIQLVLVHAIRLRNRLSSAKWLIISLSILNTAFFISLLEQSTLLPSSILTVYAINMGVVLQFMFLSIGIAETVKDAYKEKNKTQAELIEQFKRNEILKEKVTLELEEKVEERTTELNFLNEELKNQVEENQQMNIALDLVNNKLKKSIQSFMVTSVMTNHLSFEDFSKAFPTEFACVQHLKELKERKGFCCIKCGNIKTIKGKDKFDVRCSSCNYNESLTANTIFHRTKIPLQKAFYILYIIANSRVEPTSAELSKILDIQTGTCQGFKKKIKTRILTLKKEFGYQIIHWDLLITSAAKAQ